MYQSEKRLYTAKIRTVGGRDGSSKSSDGQFDIKLSSPGSSKVGTNPEQLFGAGWSACFIGAMELAAKELKIVFPHDASDDVEVDLWLTNGAYSLRARHMVTLPGIARDIALQVIDLAHQTCPYSKATRGNIDVEFTVFPGEPDSKNPDRSYRPLHLEREATQSA